MTLSNRSALLSLVLICLVVYLPGLTALPPFDQDEALFAQASRQMLETGDFVQIRFQEEARNRKPALHFDAPGPACTTCPVRPVPRARSRCPAAVPT